MLAEVITQVIDRFYLPFVARMMPRQTFRYAACGGVNMGLDLLWYAVFYNFILGQRFTDLGVVVISPHIAAMLLVFPITFLTGFWLNGHVAFRSSLLTTRVQLLRYALSVVGAVLLNYVCLKFLVELCGIWPTPAKALTTLISIVYSYMAAKYFTFRHAAE